MPIRLSLRYKGGPGSGNKGHAGIPGHLGGSMPGGGGSGTSTADNPATPKSNFGVAQPIADMFTYQGKLLEMKSTLDRIKSGVESYRKKHSLQVV